ncbi:hypothetical protein BC628DRAFT_1376826 [Trametes gibbosa]|nr:hypothetical protein BC628DRAFT_1376826 [Trametes gibbosa]
MSLAACDDCRLPSMTPYKPNPHLYAVGDICAIFETPSVPVYLILTQGPPPSGSTSRIYQSARSMLAGLHNAKAAVTGRTSSHSGGSTESSDTRPKPALILQDVILPYEEGDSDKVTVCLLATFRATFHREDLPLILRHFCIPVSPHHLATEGEVHIHTIPQWEKSESWLIAIPFQSKVRERICGRWMDKRKEAEPDGSFKLNVQARAALQIECEMRRQEWERQCHEEGSTLANDALKDYKSRERKARRKAAKSKNFQGSFGSGPSSSHARSPIHIRSGSDLHTAGGSFSPVGTRPGSQLSPSSSKGSFLRTKMDIPTNLLAAETQHESQTTNPQKSGPLPAATSPLDAASSGTQVAQHALSQGVSTELLDGDVQEIMAQTSRPLSPSFVDQSQRSSTAERARPKRTRIFNEIIVKLPSTFRQLTGSDSSIAPGASEGSGRPKER